jgi:hypothetical protein
VENEIFCLGKAITQNLVLRPILSQIVGFYSIFLATIFLEKTKTKKLKIDEK